MNLLKFWQIMLSLHTAEVALTAKRTQLLTSADDEQKKRKNYLSAGQQGLNPDPSSARASHRFTYWSLPAGYRWFLCVLCHHGREWILAWLSLWFEKTLG